jgi:putative membrane protein (TIGR04086 family)
MRTHSENQAGIGAYIRPLLIGTVIGIVCMAVCLVLAALLMTLTDIPQTAVTVLSVIAGVVGAFAGGWSAGRIAEQRGLIVGAFCGLLLFFTVLILGIILHRSIQIGFLFVKLAVLLLAGMTGGVVGVNKK